MFGRFKYGNQICNINSYICCKKTSSGTKTKAELSLGLVRKIKLCVGVTALKL